MLFIPLEVIPYFALFHSFSGGKVIMKTPCWILIALSQPYFKKVVHFHFSFIAFISPGISNNSLSLFSFRQVEMIEYLEYLFSVLWEDGMSSRSFFRTAAGVRKNWRPIGMFYLPLFFKGPLFYASGFCAHFFSSPSSPPKKLPKTGYQEQENEVNCFNSPPHFYGVTFPTPVSIPSLPVWVCVIVWPRCISCLRIPRLYPRLLRYSRLLWLC